MDTAAPVQTAPLRLGRSNGVECSWAQGRCLSRRVIVVATENCLGFSAIQPFDKGCCAVFVGRVFQSGGVEDQRLWLIRFSVYGEADVRVIGANILPAQVDLRRQRDVWKIERAGLDFIGRSGV